MTGSPDCHQRIQQSIEHVQSLLVSPTRSLGNKNNCCGLTKIGNGCIFFLCSFWGFSFGEWRSSRPKATTVNPDHRVYFYP
jgi:hypothetical protein